jgi:hypothetical protein
MRTLTYLALWGAASIATPSLAADQVYSTPTALAGNQAWTGTLGLDFTVNSAVTISSLGVFDDDGDGLLSNLSVAIYDSVSKTIVGPTVMFAANTDGTGQAYLFQSVTPFSLAPGSYQLASWGYNGVDRNFNTHSPAPGGPIVFNSLNGALTAVGVGYSNEGTGGAYGNIAAAGPTRFGAGSMIAAAPEPGTWALMLLGFGGIGYSLRRRAAAKLACASG